MSAWKQSLITVVLVLAVALAGAAVGGVVAANYVMHNFQARVRIPEQPMSVKLDKPVDVVADLVNPVSVAVEAHVSTDVPVDQHFKIPLDQNITAEATINHEVPVKVDVHIKQDVPLDTKIYLNTVVTLPVMGSTVDVPVKAWVPLKTRIPVDVVVPIDQKVPLSFTAPVSAHIHQTFDVPLRVKVNADVPVKTTVQVPLVKNLHAQVHMPDTAIQAVVQQTDISVPLSNVQLEPTKK
ncbi:MAG: hypothetical protein JST54_32680 [Deltaproteobacteria bacterium]|nr:hypothetical protein [Deltaproteobacteria bacterium]